MTDSGIKPTSEAPERVAEKLTVPEKPEVQIESPEQLDVLRAEMRQGITDLARTDIQAIQNRVEQTTASLGLGSEEGQIMTERQASEIRIVEQTALAQIEASKIGQSLSAIPSKENFEPVGVGASTLGGSPIEQTTSQNLLTLLETGRVGGKPASIEAEAPKEAEIGFDPEAHAKQLREKVKTLLDRPEIDDFFSQLHPDDLKDLVGVLSRESINQHLGRLADLLRSSIKNKENFAQGTERHTKEQMRQLFIQFKTDFDKVLDQVFTRAEILGMSELDIDAAIKRSNELILAQRRKLGPGPIQNFVDSLAYRALAEVRREIEKQKKTQQATEIPAPQEEVAEKREQPQEWLDQKREAAYADLNKIFAELEQSGGTEAVQKWFTDFFNPALIEAGIEPLKPEDVQSLRYLEVISESATKIAGKEIARPILIFTDIGEYQRFSTRLQGKQGMSSRGMNLPRDMFAEGDLLRETGLLIATGNKAFIGHEIRHSIDPNLESRNGYDSILDEAFAYYQQDIVDARLEGYAHLTKPEDGPWRTFAGSIGGEIYGETYAKDAGKTLTSEELKNLTQDVVAAIRSISEKHGHLETQRLLVQTKSIDELLKATR